MSRIILSTLNARHAHASFGLRYLMANLGELQSSALLLEFDINQRPLDIAESILAADPTIIGLGIYIWNANQSLELVRILKSLRPDLPLILGGPEISHETELQEITALADFVIQGEADLYFADLCRQILSGRRPLYKIHAAPLPDVAALKLPYDLYTDADIAHRVIYVEASRGCPFRCEFCLSSLDIPLRNVPLDPFLASLSSLLERGTRQFKFVDRTFNLNPAISTSILDFFLAALDRFPNLFLHFEMIPDRLPDALRDRIIRFPPGSLQFEVGIQTFNPQVAERISRRQDNAKAEANLRFLRTQTTVHIHADLIAGLPGEDLAGFAAGFDRLHSLGVHEIQLGILKRLRGAPIARHDEAWGMVYRPDPPYEILQTAHMDYPTLMKLRRFARHWDLIANSGRFAHTLPLLLRDGTAFFAFWTFSTWLHERTGQRTSGISLTHLRDFVGQYLRSLPDVDEPLIAAALTADDPSRKPSPTHLPPRQARRLREVKER
jgi:hypothetical protein